MVASMISQLPKFFRTISKEHDEVDQLIQEHQIDYVISDNRYGCWTRRVPCAFITHQSNILMPKRFGWMGSWVRRINEGYIAKFSVCWIPDFPDARLSGAMLAFGKKDLKVPYEFIGSPSRLRPIGGAEKKYDVVAIFSGPEPQRTIFERIVTEDLMNSGLRYFIVRGIVPGKKKEGKANIVDFLQAHELEQVISESEVVLARSGYSSIMDLSALGKKAILIPTPGQTEQEYLANQLKERNIAFTMTQSEFDLDKAWKESEKYTGFTSAGSDVSFMKKAISKFLGT
jgi:UDP-N-acetylglucosamine transferase subunit ALG13